jgi:citrate lyase subunit beta/citryl-CoA lyase
MSEPPSRRSVLYLPGANERALTKALALPVDALILDLEDAVAPEAKVTARQRVCAAIGDYAGREVTVRVNAVGTRWHDADLRAVAEAGPDAVVVPKIDSAEQVLAVEQTLREAGAPDRTAIWAMIESPLAVTRVVEIAGATDRLTVLVMGTNDLLKELRARHRADRAPLLAALSLCVLAARAADRTILDGVFNDIRDSVGFAAECLQGRQFGFDGKTLIHPGQIEECNRVFSPSDTEIAYAHRVIDAYDQARASGRGVATVDGRMIENLHVDNARWVLATARALTHDTG